MARRPYPPPKSISVVLSEELYRKIHTLADLEFMTAASYVRRLIARLPDPEVSPAEER
jgi:hypothetical protein